MKTAIGFWRLCDPDNLKYCSAAAYYAAWVLRQELHVPVGIIGCNFGGTSIRCWMDEKTLKKHGQVWMDDYEEILFAQTPLL